MAIQMYVVSNLPPYIIDYPEGVVPQSNSLSDGTYRMVASFPNGVEVETMEGHIAIFYNDNATLVSSVKHIENRDEIDALFSRFNLSVQYINREEQYE